MVTFSLITFLNGPSCWNVLVFTVWRIVQALTLILSLPLVSVYLEKTEALCSNTTLHWETMCPLVMEWWNQPPLCRAVSWILCSRMFPQWPLLHIRRSTVSCLLFLDSRSCKVFLQQPLDAPCTSHPIRPISTRSSTSGWVSVPESRADTVKWAWPWFRAQARANATPTHTSRPPAYRPGPLVWTRFTGSSALPFILPWRVTQKHTHIHPAMLLGFTMPLHKC